MNRKKIHRPVSWILSAACLCLLLLNQAATAGEKAHFAGNHSISSPVISRWLVDLEDCPADSLARRIQDRYRRFGFYDAVVTTVAEETSLSLQIDEGLPVKLGAISVNLPDDFDDSIVRSIVQDAVIGIASADNIDRSLSRVVQEMADAGYPLVRISPVDFAREGQQLVFTLDINPGPQVRVGGWRISGLTRTDTMRVRKALTLQAGTVWNNQERKRIKRELRYLDYLRLAGEMSIVDCRNDTLVIVDIPLSESPVLVADGGLGLAGGGTVGGLRGRLQLGVENPFGGGRQMDLLISRPANNASHSRLSFADPQIVGSWLGISLELEQQRQSSVYDRFSGAAGASIFWNRTLETEFEARWAKITPLAGSAHIFPARSYDFSLSSGHGLRHGLKQHTQTSTRWRASLTASVRREFRGTSVTADNSLTRLRVTSALWQSWRVAPRLALIFSGSSESWLGSDENIRWGDELYLGGPETIRGFAERSFTARGYMLLSTEIGYYPVSRIRIFFFSDIAYLRPFALREPGRLWYRVTGYGLGLETTNYLGSTRVEVGWPEDGAARDGVIYLRWLRGW